MKKSTTWHNILKFFKSSDKENFSKAIIKNIIQQFLSLPNRFENSIINMSKRIHIAMFIATPFTIAKLWNQPKCPSVCE
jgi:hypothetical protein